ncbi:MAG: hypothetical protein JWL73_2867, partial [Actinomycetia bacterium]|nr:hypothetical protein [Actinomycetes bacterium]
AAAAAQEIAARAYIKSVASTPVSVADELAKLADLRDRGIIDEVDFQRLKAQLVGADVAPGTATV